MKEKLSPYIQYMYSYPHKTAYRTFATPIYIGDYTDIPGKEHASLYFHIPFCRYKCGYCNLFSIAGCSTDGMDAYLKAMEKQVEQLAPMFSDWQFSSFAIGGGTPLLLTSGQMERLWKMAGWLGVDPLQTPVAIETSPEFASLESLLTLKERGVQRISIGIQSFREQELKQLRRFSSPATVRKALETIREVDFPSFNVDLIYGMEGQTVESFTDSIRQALSYQPTGLFVYPLYVRPEMVAVKRVPDEECMRFYRIAVQLLREAGYKQTSMRRFIRKESVEMEFSCGDEVMLACGAGGRSYLGDLHTATPYAVRTQEIRSVLRQYADTVDHRFIRHGYLLSEEKKRRRFMIKNLMYYKGLDRHEYEERFGTFPELPVLGMLRERGWIKTQASVFYLTEEGLAWSDYIGQLFISPAVREAMEAYSFNRTAR